MKVEKQLKTVNWKNVFSLFGVISLVLSVIWIGIMSNNQNFNPQSMAARRTSPTPTSGSGMTLTSETYQLNHPGTNCLGVDDSLHWAAAGSLQPGEEYTFTPSHLSCRGEVPGITTKLTWDSSNLELSSVVPYPDYTSEDPEQQGKTIVAPHVGNTAALCMFPDAPDSTTTYNYTIRVRNVGTTTATNIHVDGDWNDGWEIFYYHRCINADADHDGFNDSLEHLTSELTYHTDYPPNGGYQRYTHYIGSNYLRTAGSDTQNDQVDFYPPDFNDDNRVDSTDVASVSAHLGEGNGVSMSLIGANPQDPYYFGNQFLVWRRYDLNGDGYVNQADLNWSQALVGQPIPMQTDILQPITNITMPTANSVVSAGTDVEVGAFAADNQAVSRVDMYVDGTFLCTANGPNSSAHNPGLPPNPEFYCWWHTPKRRATHTVYSKVYDGSGNTSVSSTITVNAQ